MGSKKLCRVSFTTFRHIRSCQIPDALHRPTAISSLQIHFIHTCDTQEEGASENIREKWLIYKEGLNPKSTNGIYTFFHGQSELKLQKNLWQPTPLKEGKKRSKRNRRFEVRNNSSHWKLIKIRVPSSSLKLEEDHKRKRIARLSVEQNKDPCQLTCLGRWDSPPISH